MSKGFLSAFGMGVLALAAASLAPTTAQAAIIPVGDIVLVRVGDGTTALTNAQPVTLDHYKVNYTGGVPTSVTLQQSLPVQNLAVPPTTGNRNLTMGGGAAGEGGLIQSGSAQYMTFAGYNRFQGQTTNGGASDLEDRVVGRLDLATGNIDTTTAFTTYSGATQGGTAARGAYLAANNSDVWMAASTGTRVGNFGVDNTGTGAGRQVDGTNNSRRVGVFGNTLYQTEAANSRSGVEYIGPLGGPPPTSTGNTVTLLPGFSTTNTTYSPYDYWFANSTTLYISDDSASASTAPGLQKWSFNGTTWTLVFNHSIAAINPGGSTAVKGLRSLTGMVDGSGNVVLFGSTVGTAANLLLGMTDTLSNTNPANVTENTLVNASTSYTGSVWNLRGVDLNLAVPEPTSLGFIGIAAVGFLSRRSRRS